MGKVVFDLDKRRTKICLSSFLYTYIFISRNVGLQKFRTAMYSIHKDYE